MPRRAPDALVVVETTPALTEELPSTDEPLALGQWYWAEGSGTLRLWCIVHLGSNYARLRSVGGHTWRMHFDRFHEICTREIDPDSVIAREIAERQGHVHQLLGQIQELTARLALGQSPALGAGGETAALALRMSDDSAESYQAALVKAKKEELPALFDQLEKAHDGMARWMKAKVMPLRAQAEELKGVIDTIDQRIFSVQLYAGLVEQVHQIKDGAPAALGDKIHLLQRLAYMDEECLARYEAGGMEFKDLDAFDAWMARPEHRDRILPFPRCVVSMQVRRRHKHRAVHSIEDFISLGALREADESTFLYIRNGEQLFRLSTKHEFGSKLFPDMDADQLRGKLWGHFSFSDECKRLISDNEYQALLAEERERRRELAAKREAAPKKDRWMHSDHGFDSVLRDYKPFDRSEVHYDEMAKKVAADMRHHNRIALILQGLLDRSPVLHPHPPWRIWTDEGFRQALTLVYDDSRALVAGATPDFEAFRIECNKSIRVGAVTVGQEDVWLRQEAKREEAKRARSSRHRGERYRASLSHYRPYGNPGPGLLAPVRAHVPRSGKCTYTWCRKRQTVERYYMRRGDDIPVSLVCYPQKLLCVDGYQPGDFHRFFDDPRTRADYLQWAPLLLVAEDYHAGKRQVRTPGTREHGFRVDYDDD